MSLLLSRVNCLDDAAVAALRERLAELCVFVTIAEVKFDS